MANLRNDTVNLFEYGFNILKSEPIAISGTVIEEISIENGEKDANTLEVIIEDTIYATMHNMEDASSFTPIISIEPSIKAPIAAGQVIGTAVYKVNDVEYTTNLIAGNSVNEKIPVIETATQVVKDTATVIVKIFLWIA